MSRRPTRATTSRRHAAVRLLLLALLVLLLGLAAGWSAGVLAVRADPGTGGASSPASAAPTAAPPLTVVGLGDSVPAAKGCDCAGFLEQASTALDRATGRRVVLHNDAVSGWTTGDVVAALGSGAAADDLRAGADLVVVEIGANDFDLTRLTDASCTPAATSSCFRPTLATVRTGLTEVVARVRHLDPTAGARVALMGYWNVGVDGAVGRQQGSTYTATSDALTRAFNEVVKEVAATTGSLYVDGYAALKGDDGSRDPSEDLLADGDHPDHSGHTRLADAVLDSLQAAGLVSRWSAS